MSDPERTIPIGPWRVNRAKLLVRRTKLALACRYPIRIPGCRQDQKPAQTGKGGRGQRRQGEVSGDLSQCLPEE